ncbi:hypothetical protein QTP88_018933 [Uroleucon formosanum]
MWGCLRDDARGNLLVNFVASLDLISCNVGSSSTYVRYNAQSIVDVTFARLDQGAEIRNWRVRLDLNSESDNRYITYELARGPQFELNRPHVSRCWAVRKLDWMELRTRLTNVPQQLTLQDGSDPDVKAGALNDILVDLCDHSMPHRFVLRSRKTVHWWSDEIAAIRQASCRARRRYQRAGRRDDAEERAREREAYSSARKELRRAIRLAQVESWNKLCLLVDEDPGDCPTGVDIRRWVYQSRLEVMTFHMAQALSGHGCYQHYLWKRKRAANPYCMHCEEPEDTVEHTLFNCPFWAEDRREMEQCVGRPLRPNDVPDIILGPEQELLPDDAFRRRRIEAMAEK